MKQCGGFALVELGGYCYHRGLDGCFAAVLGKVRKQALAATCQSNLHQIGLAGELFAQDNDNCLRPIRMRMCFV